MNIEYQLEPWVFVMPAITVGILQTLKVCCFNDIKDYKKKTYLLAMEGENVVSL